MPNYSYCSDKYQYTMGKSFFDTGRKDVIAVFNLFYRVAPENNNWAVCSGTEEAIECVLNLRDQGKCYPRIESDRLRQVKRLWGVAQKCGALVLYTDD